MRIYDANNDPLDFCAECFLHEDECFEIYGPLASWHCEHPPYSEGDYVCHECCCTLTDKDD